MSVVLRAFGFMLIIVVGYLFKEKGVFTRNQGQFLSKVIVMITLPCALLSTANTMTISLSLMGILFIGIITNIIPIVYGYFLERKSGPVNQAMAMLNIPSFGIGTFVLPFVQSFFPASHLVYVCLFDIGNSLMSLGLTYSFASLVAHPEEKFTLKAILKRLFSSIPFVIYLIIFVLAACHIQLPEGLISIVSIPGGENAFLCMLMIGIMLEIKLDKKDLGTVFKYLGSRYVIVLLMALSIYFFTTFDIEVKKVLMILLCGPVAQMTTIYSLQIDPDNVSSVAINSISILISVILITLLLIVLI